MRDLHSQSLTHLHVLLLSSLLTVVRYAVAILEGLTDPTTWVGKQVCLNPLGPPSFPLTAGVCIAP